MSIFAGARRSDFFHQVDPVIRRSSVLRMLFALSLSCVLMGAVGCGRAGDNQEKLSKEEAEKKAKEQMEKQKESTMKAMQGMGREVPTPEGGAEGGTK
jgi:hypothetical protein